MSDFSKQTLESMSQAVWYNKWTLDKFKSYVNGNILEVGCGIGNFTKTLINFGKVWAIDIEKKYIEETKASVGDRAKVGIGDIEKNEFFFNDNKFNSEICINVLEHIKDDKKALKNLYNLLENNGYLILIVPSHPFLYGKIDKSIGHFRRYTKNDIKDKLRMAGFIIEDIKTINLLGAIGWLIANKIFSDNLVSNTKIKIFNLIAPFFLGIENFIEPPIGTSILAIAKKEKI